MRLKTEGAKAYCPLHWRPKILIFLNKFFKSEWWCRLQILQQQKSSINVTSIIASCRCLRKRCGIPPIAASLFQFHLLNSIALRFQLISKPGFFFVEKGIFFSISVRDGTTFPSTNFQVASLQPSNIKSILGFAKELSSGALYPYICQYWTG